MRSKEITLVQCDALHERGFDGWWNAIEKLLGCNEWGDGHAAFIIHMLLVGFRRHGQHV